MGTPLRLVGLVYNDEKSHEYETMTALLLGCLVVWLLGYLGAGCLVAGYLVTWSLGYLVTWGLVAWLVAWSLGWWHPALATAAVL